MNNTNKIIINSAVTYLSLLIKVIIGLFSVRLVLKALGEVDYGVYVIVGGIVALLDVLNSNMTNTSMRFLAHSLGSKDEKDIIVTFNTTVFIHYLIAFLSILLLEAGGFLMFKYIVDIPFDKIFDAKIVFQFMVATTFLTVISVPYDAVTNAHERIWVLSIFDVISSILVLLSALLLFSFNSNRLIIYGLSLFLIQLVLRICKVVYAKRHFGECNNLSRKLVQKEKVKSIITFTGWNLFGSIAALGVTQIRSILINVYFGVRPNAAEGITRQVTSPINMIVTSMTRAITPQIMKNEGGGNHDKMRYVVMLGAKYSSFIFALFGIPLVFYIPEILNWWLEEVPEYAAVFCRITLLSILLEKFTFQIDNAISAVGDIRNYQIAGAICNTIYLPFAWLLFTMGYSPVSIYILTFFALILMFFIRLYYGKKVAGINPLLYCKKAVFSVLIPLLNSIIPMMISRTVLGNSLIYFFLSCISFCALFIILFWLIGVDEKERIQWKTIVSRVFAVFTNYIRNK